MLKQYNEFFKSLMLANDLLIISLAWWFAYLLRFHTTLFPPPQPYVFRHYLVAWLLILLSWGLIFKFLDLYRPRRMSARLPETADIIKGSLLALLAFLGIIFLLRDFIISRIVVVLFWTLSVPLLILSHVVFREIMRFVRQRGYNLRHLLVIGSPLQVKKLISKLEWHRHLGFRIAGVYLTQEAAPGEQPEHVPILKSPEETLGLVRSGNIDQVFITLPLKEAGRIGEIRGILGDEPVDTYVVLDPIELFALRGKTEEYDGLSIISVQDSPLYGWNAFLKRTMDFSLGSLALLVLSPLMALIALVIKAASTGPVFFRQERMGLDGKRFGMLKFRTMIENAEKSTGPIWATTNDPRVTRVGYWLRRTSLDELPQFYNVLKGDMSLVGPRPERPSLVEEFRKAIPKYMLRHKIKAGMTGWAQVNGWRGNTSLEKRLEHDLYYIENWCLWLDLKILTLSLFYGLFNKNAY